MMTGFGPDMTLQGLKAVRAAYAAAHAAAYGSAYIAELNKDKSK